MSHSGERFARCVHCGSKIYQRQVLGAWKHHETGAKWCYAHVGTTRATPPESPDSSSTGGQL